MPLYFHEGDYVYLKVSPMEYHLSGLKGSFHPGTLVHSWYLSNVDQWRIDCSSPKLCLLHNVFHVSQLKKCLWVPDRTIEVTDVVLEPDLTYSEHPIRVLDQKDRVTRRKTLKFYKIQWNQHSEDEATWETQDFLDKNFLGFLASCNL
jgi:hypothetical protein